LLSPQAVRAKFTIKVDSTLIDFALAGDAARRGNARPVKKVVPTGMRAVMFPFT
jgi:hypothetical protein